MDELLGFPGEPTGTACRCGAVCRRRRRDEQVWIPARWV